MPKQIYNIIIDSNLWISFLITNQFQFGKKLFTNSHIFFSEELYLELSEVVKKTKFLKYFSQESVSELLDVIKEYAEFIEVNSVVDICRDKKDNFLLALAKDSCADFLITGDNDLLILEIFCGTKIIKIYVPFCSPFI